ncbi:AAA family ATPase [Chryseobacterium taihuense]|uniref:AAA domain-containing protein n=1 Tax=Chryseobacterium taihuense TaxID=1141221 RepID=A0ABY0R2Q2_9FLAO|nr:AAA family ATPase [Chryseobacterium taihuense]SDM33304.1 AAA domain-containing protein [Chryseobacterium taihuense]
MKYKISELKIKNFKCFTDVNFDFGGDNLVVFDGPNGYGKTTSFEALEILLTKAPRKIGKARLDKRYTYENSPIHKYEDKEIEISVQLISADGNHIKVKRVFPAATNGKSKKNNISQIYSDSKLFINDEEVSSESSLEDVLDYKNVYNLFNVLNYVEQDENTYFLKEDPKERYKALVSLLGGDEERVLLEKVESFHLKLKLKVGQIQTSISDLKQNNSDLLKNKFDEIFYKKLIDNSLNDFVWDNEVIKNTDINLHNSYLNEINKIESLFNNRQIVGEIVLLDKMNKYRNDNVFIDSFINDYWSVQNYNILEDENNRKNNNKKTIETNNKIVQYINSNDYNQLLNGENILFLSEKEKIKNELEVFEVSLKLLLTLRESLSLQNQILSDLKDKRESLIILNRDHKDFIDLKEGECPICGYDWQSNEKLIQQIEETESKIFKQYNEDNTKFEKHKEDLNKRYLESFKSLIIEENESLETELSKLVDFDFFSRLKDLYTSYKSRFETFLSLFNEEVRKQINSMVNLRNIENKNLTKNNIFELIDKEKPIVETDLSIDEIITDFNLYFTNDMEKLNKLSLDEIKQKRNYIEYQYFNSVNVGINNLEERKLKLSGLQQECDEVIKKLDEKIKNYTKSIIEKISIPFYIYTGKILQNHSLGSGLVIDFEIKRGDSQIYIRPTHRDQEVTYTLSSGQLSATVISLMLVLNKVFNHSKFGTLLIDDPLQTLDEINSHSLVELLKHNFSEQQIIISTHEDRYSKFIRYKYDKFNLYSRSIRMKEII